MRRSFRSTTALAAALALMAPAALLAETPMPPKAAAAMDAASRAEMPKRAATLDKELAGGLGPDGLTCAGGEQRPCPDGEALLTPKGLAVHLSRDGAIVLAPRKEQRAAAKAEDGPAKGKAAQAAQKEDQQDAEHRKAEKKAERDEAKAEKAKAKAEREEAKAQARSERQAAKAARDSGQAEGQPDADALAASLAVAQGGGDAPLVMAQAEAPAEAPVVLPEPAPAEPAAAEPAAPGKKPAPAAKADRAKPQAQPPAEPPAAEPAPVAQEAEAPPPVEPEASPVVEEPEALTERSEPLPEPQPAPEEPAVAEPAPAAGEAAPVVQKAERKPQARPAAREPAPAGDEAEALSAPQPAPEEPAVAEPAPAEPLPQAAPEAGAEPAVAQPKPRAKPQDDKAATPDAAALAAALAAAADGKAPAAAPAEKAAGTAVAATGQEVAPTPIEVDDAAARSMEEALKKAAEARAPAAGAQKAAPGNRPSAAAAGATAADAAASAAAAGSPPVAEALNAPPTISDDATAVMVTEGSARAASEDFATRITDGLTPEQQQRIQRLQEQLAGQGGQAAQGQDGQPVVARDGSEASRDDDDNSERDLARMLLAGVGGYVLANVLANNGQIALSTPDRVVVQQPDGTQSIIKDDNALLLQPGAQVSTENFADGSSRTIVTREDGSRVVTIRDANLRVLRRTLVAADGTVTELIDDAAPVDPVVVADLPPPARPVDLSGPVSEEALRAALAQEAAVDRRFTLAQIRNIPEVRGLVAPIEINAITFDTGSAAIRPDQAQQLATLGGVISDYVKANPGEVFLIEGHTDTVGSAAMNLALSDRRAESVALALSQYFKVPPENLVVQGYGEQYLKVAQEGDIRANRRASVRRITDLLAK